jgi:2-polyprenyl-6-methoxyphenol hydroxylase-like FAD-dependent oxidoreductase
VLICMLMQKNQARLKNMCYVEQVGIPVLVLERGASLRLEGSAIAMWTNAFRALDALGVGAQLRSSHPLLERCGFQRIGL